MIGFAPCESVSETTFRNFGSRSLKQCGVAHCDRKVTRTHVPHDEAHIENMLRIDTQCHMSSTVMSSPSQPAAGPADLLPMEQIYRMYLAENRRHADGFRGWLNEQELLVMPPVLPEASAPNQSQKVMECLKNRRCLHWHPSCGTLKTLRLGARPDMLLQATTCPTCAASPLPSQAQLKLRSGCLHADGQCPAALQNDVSQPDQTVFFLCQRCYKLQFADNRNA